MKPWESDNVWLRLAAGWSPERARHLSRWPRWLAWSALGAGAVYCLSALSGAIPGWAGPPGFLVYPLAGLVLAPAAGAAARHRLLRDPAAADLLMAGNHTPADLAEALKASAKSWARVGDQLAMAGILAVLCGTLGAAWRDVPELDVAIILCALWLCMMACWAAGFRWRLALFAAEGGRSDAWRLYAGLKRAAAATLLPFCRFMGAMMLVVLLVMLIEGDQTQAFNNNSGSKVEFEAILLFGLFELLIAKRRMKKAEAVWEGMEAQLENDLLEAVQKTAEIGHEPSAGEYLFPEKEPSLADSVRERFGQPVA